MDPTGAEPGTTFHRSPQAGDTHTEWRDRTSNMWECKTAMKSVGGDPNNPSTTAKNILLDDTLSVGSESSVES